MGRWKILIGLAALGHVPHVEESGAVEHAARLLHVVRHNHDGALFDHALHELLDRQGRDRVEGRAGAVEQDDVRMHGERTGDAQTLLLTTGERKGTLVQLVLNLVPQGGAAQRLLDQGIEILLATQAVTLGREHDVLVDRLVERVRLLEHHADRTAQVVEVLLARVDVAPIVDDLALDAATLDLAIDEVQAAQERGLAAAGRSMNAVISPL